MADILIKGMEMPRGNNVLVVDSAGTITKVNRWTGKVEATDPLSFKAVALPEHGRLIDADKLGDKKSYDRDEDFEVIDWCEIENAPTIVEASK